ncbi:RES domain-containing protein [Edaphobacter modestus]|uniref:RES domain-containing protein n=1 Tax=Edaphobacter modestus TaxID=388466 RepID=A0A4Q7YG90_9BACT|nr:RES domain-containing protein [Edaphobacter modestus]RZU35794.1 RES domain-containing protein [Edaphobacter modestus]
MELEERRPTEPLYRLGRRPNAWQPPEWFLAHSDGTFGNRFDDPQGYYRVLYASSQRLACFVETLARFRPDLSLLAELDAIEGEDDFVALGTLPRDWLTVRTMGSAEIDGFFADIYGIAWVSQLRRTLAGEALRLGMKDIDLSSLERAEPRRLTQLASRKAYLLNFAGIFYRSRYGQTLENWAIFEPFSLQHAKSKEFYENDPDLLEALRLHGIRFA